MKLLKEILNDVYFASKITSVGNKKLILFTVVVLSQLTAVSDVALITILLPSILSTMPSLFATIVTPESNATSLSMPVPTNGDSGFNNGTACLIIFEPIKALLASSFSRNGIKDAATETSCLGETSM